MNALKHLQGAQSQQAVDDIFLLAFRNRDKPISAAERKSIAAMLSLDVEQSKELLTAVHQLVSESVYSSLTAEEVVLLLPSDLHDKMKKLIAKIITVHLPEWGANILQTQVSLPRLQEIDWRLDLKTASDQMHRMNVPTVIVQLKVQDTPKKVNEAPDVQNVVFEMSKEALETMLEGLGQIRDQLSRIE